eukprot:15480445-Alexandrium_andersonii.AAC.1
MLGLRWGAAPVRRAKVCGAPLGHASAGALPVQPCEFSCPSGTVELVGSFGTVDGSLPEACR